MLTIASILVFLVLLKGSAQTQRKCSSTNVLTQSFISGYVWSTYSLIDKEDCKTCGEKPESICRCTCNVHVPAICTFRGIPTLGCIKRGLISWVREGIVVLCYALVRPHLQYCIQTWSPQHKRDVELLSRGGHEDEKESGAPLLQRKTELVQLWKEKALGRPYSSPPVCKKDGGRHSSSSDQ